MKILLESYEFLMYFPEELRNKLIRYKDIQEIRIRANKKICIFKNSENIVLDFYATNKDVDYIFKRICENSIHTYQDEINKGYVTLKNGSRVGIAGTAVMEKDEIVSIKNITSLNFRIAKDYIGCSNKINNILDSNLIIAGPPCSGKTTFLRDIARKLSAIKKVCIIDERQEIFSANEHFCLDGMIDCLSGYKKDYGISIALRTLSPQVIIFDEIGTLKECNCVYESFNSGVNIVTSVHCKDKTQFLNRTICKTLLKSFCFDFVVFLSEKAGEIHKIYKIQGNDLCEYSECL